jgi:hypothetical protein
MSTFEEAFREAEEIAMRFLQVDFGFVLKDRRITDDGTNWTGGVARYESAGSRPNGPPRSWSVTLSFCPFRLELDLDISNESGASYSVAELHQLERGAGPRLASTTCTKQRGTPKHNEPNSSGWQWPCAPQGTVSSGET